jgi:ribosome-binding protein aMBF1 (putative translation factor)
MPSGGLKKSLHSAAYDRFLTLLRKAREDAGLSQVQAAKKLKKPQSFVSKCESGERRVDVVELLAFCDAYALSAERFLRALRGR